MDFRKVLAHYRKQPNNYVQHLWDKIGRQGIKPDYLRDILMFYFQHRIFPPVLQKSFDSVVMKLCEKNTTKKMRSVLIQIIDEVSYCLDPSVIVDGVWMSSSGITNVDLLNCLLHNSAVQTVIDDKIFCRLVVVLTETNLNISSIEDRCKAFTFLTTFYSEKFSIQLSIQMADWLQFSQPVPTSTQLFSSRSEVTEIDGSPGNSLTTALSLSNNMSVGHIMSVLTFSQLKIWFSSFCTPSNGNNYNDLIMAALAHCSVLVNQCSKKPSSQQDAVLRISILCEILDILYLLVEINQSLLDESILVVRQIQSHKDVSIRIKIWKFYLSFDKSNAEEYSNRMLKDYVSRCFTVSMDCYELLNTILDNAKILRPLLVKYHPNLFKIFATHPQTLIEEFIELVPYLTKSYDSDDIIEVFHRLVDLPVLSAVVCIHQSPALLQAGYSDQVLSKLHNLYVSNNNPVYEHFIKTTAISQHTSKIIHLYPEFFSQIEKLNTQGLVQTCSQAVPLLIDAFLSSAINTESNAAALLPFLLSRLALVFQVPGYKEQFHSLIGDVLKNVFSLHPVLANHSSVLKFITNVKNMELSTTVYLDLIWALGEYTIKSELLSEHFEIVECALWEILSTTNTNHNFNHLNIMVTTLARLSCQSQDLLPRTVLSLNKVLAKAQEHDNQSPEVVALHQLSSLLKNPNIASVLLAPAGEGDKTMAAMIKAVTLFTGL